MKNPWKRYSNINPQRENGNRQICNDVYHAILAGNFTGAEYKIILAIIDKTWGFKKKAGAISIKQLCAMTNLTKRTTQRTIISLKTKRVVYMSPSTIRMSTGSPLNNFSLNKHYDTWKVEGCQVVQGCQTSHPLKTNKGDIDGKIRVSSTPPTKETLKETITKEIELPDWLPSDLWNEFRKYRIKIRKPLTLHAEKLNIDKLEKLKLTGNDPVKVIEETIMRGWQGFFPLKNKETQEEPNGYQPPLEEILA